MNILKEYCCKAIQLAVTDPEIPISYSPILREYNLNLRSPASQGINYCPWCGTELPKSLRDVFFNILQENYNITDGILEILDNKKLPQEFKSDIWWKKRGL